MDNIDQALYLELESTAHNCDAILDLNGIVIPTKTTTATSKRRQNKIERAVLPVRRNAGIGWTLGNRKSEIESTNLSEECPLLRGRAVGLLFRY